MGLLHVSLVELETLVRLEVNFAPLAPLAMTVRPSPHFVLHFQVLLPLRHQHLALAPRLQRIRRLILLTLRQLLALQSVLVQEVQLPRSQHLRPQALQLPLTLLRPSVVFLAL